MRLERAECPECQMVVSRQGLGSHRRLKHGSRAPAAGDRALLRRIEVLETRIEALEALAEQGR